MKNLRINYKTIFILAFILIIYRANAQLLTGLILFPNDEKTNQMQTRYEDINYNVCNTNSNKIPQNYKLYDNYPDPFVPISYIKFDIPEAGKITLEILDVKGKVLNTLINKYLFAVSYTIKWDAGLHPEGAYFFKLTSKDFCKSKAMLIIK